MESIPVAAAPVTMTCMTTKKKFDVDAPEVVLLRNGRYAYKATCPWEGKGGKQLAAFKFCSSEAYREFTSRAVKSESEHLSAEGEHSVEVEP